MKDDPSLVEALRAEVNQLKTALKAVLKEAEEIERTWHSPLEVERMLKKERGE